MKQNKITKVSTINRNYIIFTIMETLGRNTGGYTELNGIAGMYANRKDKDDIL